MSPDHPHHRQSPADVRRREAFVQLARVVGGWLHESQRERGVSLLHVTSGGRLFGRDLAAQRTRTDARARGAQGLAEVVAPTLLGGATPLDRIAEATRAVAVVRTDIDGAHATAASVLDTFSALNTELLTAVDSGVAHVSTSEVGGLALAELALLHAKEKTGLERALLGAAFVNGEPDARERVALAELVAARASYLHLYTMTAPTPAAQMLRRVLAAPPALEVKRIEERLMAPRAVRATLPVDAGAWFSTISRTIEMLGDVADATLSYFPAVH